MDLAIPYTHTEANIKCIDDVAVIAVVNEHGDHSSNLDESVCISDCVIILGKSMNPIIFPPSMVKLQDKKSSLDLLGLPL